MHVTRLSMHILLHTSIFCILTVIMAWEFPDGSILEKLYVHITQHYCHTGVRPLSIFYCSLQPHFIILQESYDCSFGESHSQTTVWCTHRTKLLLFDSPMTWNIHYSGQSFKILLCYYDARRRRRIAIMCFHRSYWFVNNKNMRAQNVIIHNLWIWKSNDYDSTRQ